MILTIQFVIGSAESIDALEAINRLKDEQFTLVWRHTNSTTKEVTVQLASPQTVKAGK